ncbi:CNP1-like family protein [Burkholderiaceae bacterium FT117]|uniref:CNP1-like family protein n=1 Tax=Zeimonas sediminis TaxID=2944268 RepID=UPI0023432358|nr:CNP1-like family protein [Zeimonas sediminis]MCM5570718.1 CNP1-like family protein [Zeimonas sediminis]
MTMLPEFPCASTGAVANAGKDKRAGRGRAAARATLAFAWLAFAGAAAAQPSLDPVNNPTIDYVAPEPDRVNAALPEAMPALPPEKGLKRIEVSATTRNRFAVDPASVSVLGRKIVQFTIVATSPSGVRNIGYEAIDCSRGQAALLAIGRDGKGWTPVGRPMWRPITADDTVNGYRRELARAWCEGAGTASDKPADMMARLDLVPQQYRY